MAKPKKPRMPDYLQPLAAKAKERHLKRPISPRVLVEGEEGGPLTFASPYAGADDEAWSAVIFEAFGTRSQSVMTHFVGSIARLISRDWDSTAHKWIPVQAELDAVLAIVNSTKPRNEAEAAAAVHLVILHLSIMQLAKRTTTHHADPHTVSVLNKSIRTYSDGMLKLQVHQGKRRTVRQSIKSETHRHEHKHVHYHGGGETAENPNQCQATDGGTRLIEASATVPGHEPRGEVVRLPSRKG
jgi:hypothetical protein